MYDNLTKTARRQSALVALAFVGLAALIAGGIGLAVYSSRFVPNVVNSIGAAAVSLSQVFTPAAKPDLSVVTASTTPDIASSTDQTAPVTVPATKPVPTRGVETSTTVPLDGSATATSSPTLSGLPDLTVTIDAVGYLTTPSTDSFVASSTVPYGSRPAVKFTIKNVGTNIAAPWHWSAVIPTTNNFLYQSQLQQPLNPGDNIQYVLGFDQAIQGASQPVTITANYDKLVTESSYTNDQATATLTILNS